MVSPRIILTPIRALFPGLLFSLFCSLHAWQTPAPAAAKDTTFYGGTVRAQMRYGNWLPLLEANYRLENASQGNPRPEGIANTGSNIPADFRQQSFHATLGNYYNILPQVMVGGFYRYALGERHRNDWTSLGWITNQWDWFWLNTNNRPEHAVIGDITLRHTLKFLPGENWVFELKNRMHYTWYSDGRYELRDNWGRHSANVAETKYVLRPGLQYFWLDGDRPFMTFFLQYEAHFALNFGSRALVESWGYFGFFYHITEEVALGLNIARAQWWWTESDSVKNIRSNPAGGTEMCATTVGGPSDTVCNNITYTATQRAFIIGFTAMLRLDFTPIE
jgi:hypothetical protein